EHTFKIQNKVTRKIGYRRSNCILVYIKSDILKNLQLLKFFTGIEVGSYCVRIQH
ncbi:Hypothetical predicted protein, partial [Octopus vulgaris]